MSDSTTTDPRLPVTDTRTRRARQRGPYLPSAQVVEELASLKDLSTLADELRDRLTETTD